ncbi:hypothetical protein AVEN_172665-1 [Araneus ventricosus]|uniref:Uncharacterized protein n=1 Tax=Araneus ventricosus TaxID=182803 RepID=A0A4Y2HK84_ARAVE|nr:hypothetical protein AVEN_172665-1 [Araneus ventricosus]
MDFDVAEIITLLCKLADSEDLKVTSNENSRFSVEEILKINQLSEQPVEELPVAQAENIYEIDRESEDDYSSSAHDQGGTRFQGISIGGILGLVITSFQAVFSRTWNHVFGNYQMSINVRVAPVSSVLQALPSRDQNILAQRIRQIMEQNPGASYEALAVQIEQDSSLLRRIILRYLVEYVDKDLSMPVIH